MWSIFLCNFTVERTIEIPGASISLLLRSFCNYGTYHNQSDAYPKETLCLSAWHWSKPLPGFPSKEPFSVTKLHFSSPPRGNSLPESCQPGDQAQLSTANFLCMTLKSSPGPRLKGHLQGLRGLRLQPPTTSGGSLIFPETLKNRRQQNKNNSIINHQICTGK